MWKFGHLVIWCSEKNLELNSENSGDDCRFQDEPTPSHPNTCSRVNIHGFFHLLRAIITLDLRWELIKNAQQCLYFLWQLKKLKLPKTMVMHSTLQSLSPSLSPPSSPGMLAPLWQQRADCSVSSPEQETKKNGFFPSAPGLINTAQIPHILCTPPPSPGLNVI